MPCWRLYTFWWEENTKELCNSNSFAWARVLSNEGGCDGFDIDFYCGQRVLTMKKKWRRKVREKQSTVSGLLSLFLQGVTILVALTYTNHLGELVPFSFSWFHFELNGRNNLNIVIVILYIFSTLHYVSCSGYCKTVYWVVMVIDRLQTFFSWWLLCIGLIGCLLSSC